MPPGSAAPLACILRANDRPSTDASTLDHSLVFVAAAALA